MLRAYNKNDCAKKPPMGWNSYDYYNTMVNEQQIRSNAEFIAKNLKEFGWEYVVIDIQWSDKDAGKMNNKNIQYIPFSRFSIDEYSRQIPAINRFPSSKDNKGFGPLADYIHSLGLKFGIHIMRGIPRFACHEHLPIKTHDNTLVTADQIANAYSICAWNPDMYGVDFKNPYAQDYYDSLFEQYASWGVDFVKVDDICRHVNEEIYEAEVKMIAKAIENSGREMVLSLSPGPAIIEKAYLYEQYANMWRITDDFWDNWDLLKNMFYRCEVWQKHSSEGNWPDCDMIPLNDLGFGWGNGGWKCKFNESELRTMITLWSIFRSPLMLGTELTTLDNFSLSLITNKNIIHLNKLENQAVLEYSGKEFVIWANQDSDYIYKAIFNISDSNLSYTLEDLDSQDLWTMKKYFSKCEVIIEPHDVFVYSLKKK